MSQKNIPGPVPASRCAYCSRPISIPATATNKRFCGRVCRQSWHRDQRRTALELLRAQNTVTAEKEKD